jgi:hypothetical protein
MRSLAKRSEARRHRRRGLAPQRPSSFERRGLDFEGGAGESFEMRFFERLPDWRKVGWIVGGLFFLYGLGRVTMWLRGVD